MNEALKILLKRIADPLIFGNILIAVCSVSLILATYIQLGMPPVVDALLFFTFFSTLALYNFHRFMGMCPSEYAALPHPVLHSVMHARMKAAGAPVQTMHVPVPAHAPAQFA